ncbi:type I-B CRISPR-associated protein Cas5b [Sulfurihydrogenibium sp.]|uniref:type I-B CRISPR-associated protein Cas5b n=1 Tax=Sulfurihydrogenibium sp. TaxID=2053621 RepID=UPI002603F0A3|nr:type I-B CRISPR-associated protein Cas5b [Sulfurihydrogenibium sp.]
MKVLAFDLWGDYGHFKKFYTTSSPLTFSIPPNTAIYGMIGAIIGLAKEEYLKHINGRTTKIGIEILKPIKKTRITLNYIDTKQHFYLIKGRTQIRTEFLKEPAYRLYIHISDENLFNELINRVKTKQSYYTLSLGLANLLANFQFKGLYDVETLEQSDKVNSVILTENVESIEMKEGKKYFKERIPLDMKEDREVICYKEIVMELEGNTIEGKFKNCYKVGDRIISFLTP